MTKLVLTVGRIKAKIKKKRKKGIWHRLMHEDHIQFHQLTNTQNQLQYDQILLTIKTTLKHRIRRAIVWRAWNGMESVWLWTENNTCPHNMIIILGLNNVLWYSVVCAVRLRQHRHWLRTGLNLSAVLHGNSVLANLFGIHLDNRIKYDYCHVPSSSVEMF